MKMSITSAILLCMLCIFTAIVLSGTRILITDSRIVIEVNVLSIYRGLIAVITLVFLFLSTMLCVNVPIYAREKNMHGDNKVRIYCGILCVGYIVSAIGFIIAMTNIPYITVWETVYQPHVIQAIGLGIEIIASTLVLLRSRSFSGSCYVK